jgi:hypothetical protein
MRRASFTPEEVNLTNRVALAAFGVLLGLVACKGDGDGGKGGAEEDKKAFETAGTQMKEPIALIAAYRPYLTSSDDNDAKDKYAPKRRSELSRAASAAANEVRHAANGVHQSMPSAGGPAMKELDTALVTVSTDCAEASDDEAYAKCRTSVDALDKALAKAQEAASAAGASAKIPRIAPESVTDQAKKAIAPFLKARGPGPQEKAFMTKRSDTSASIDDVVGACQGAAGELDAISKAFEHADEPLRVLAVTHKMSIDSQCNTLNATDTLRKDVDDCRKKAKTPDCKIVCGKAKGVVENGVPAAAFTPLEKDVGDICKD